MKNKLKKMVSVFCVLAIVITAFAAVGRNVKAEIETQTEYTEEEIENQFLGLLTSAGFNAYVSVQEDVNGNYRISFGSDNPGYYECTLTPTQVDYFMKSSNNINPTLGKEQNINEEFERDFLNPFVATDGSIHMVWQEKADDNFEIFYTNDEGKQYENTLKQVRENLNGKSSENMDKAIEFCLENDYRHSIVWVHKSIKNLEKTGNTETINILIDSVKDFAKTNILYAEYDLTFNNTYIQEAYDKYYLAMDKYEEKNYDAAVEQFKNSYLKIVEAYEEKHEIFTGVDFGETVRISYTDYDSVAPEVFLNGLISIGWMEVLPEENHVYYARSSNNGVSWWYFDATVHGGPYLTYWGMSSSILTPRSLISIDIALLLLLLILIILALIIILIWCHFFYGILIDRTYGPIDDPYLNTYSPYDAVSVGDNIFNIPRRICGGDGNGNGNGNGPEPAPDLTVTNIYFSDTYVLQGDTTTVYATIKNQATLATMSGTIYAEFRYGTSYDTGATIDEVQIPAPLPPYPDPDCTTTVSVSWTPTTGASFDTTVYVMADSEGDVTEGNEGNNIGSVSCHVFNPTADDDDDGLTNDVEIKGEVTRYIVDKGDKGYLFYNVAPASYDKIFTYHTNPLEADTDLDGQNDYNDLVPLDYDMDGDGYINVPDLVYSWSPYYVERFVDPVANDPNLIRDGEGNLINDEDMDDDGILDHEFIVDHDIDWDADGMSNAYEMRFGVYAEGTTHDESGEWVDNEVDGKGWQNPLIYNAKYALIVGGYSRTTYGGSSDYDWFRASTKNMYITLRDHYGYTDENIFYLFTLEGGDTDTENIVDMDATEANVQAVFNNFKSGGTKEMGTNDFLFVCWINHGGDDHYNPATGEDTVMGSDAHDTYFPLENGDRVYDHELATYVSGISTARTVFILQPCCSGGFINDLSSSGRVIGTAVRENEVEGGWIEKVIDGFNGAGDTNPDVGNNNGYVSVQEAWGLAARHVYSGSTVHSQLDDNGDGLGHDYLGYDMLGNYDGGYDINDTSKDGYLAACTYL